MLGNSATKSYLGFFIKFVYARRNTGEILERGLLMIINKLDVSQIFGTS